MPKKMVGGATEAEDVPIWLYCAWSAMSGKRVRLASSNRARGALLLEPERLQVGAVIVRFAAEPVRRRGGEARGDGELRELGADRELRDVPPDAEQEPQVELRLAELLLGAIERVVRGVLRRLDAREGPLVDDPRVAELVELEGLRRGVRDLFGEVERRLRLRDDDVLLLDLEFEDAERVDLRHLRGLERRGGDGLARRALARERVADDRRVVGDADGEADPRAAGASLRRIVLIGRRRVAGENVHAAVEAGVRHRRRRVLVGLRRLHLRFGEEQIEPARAKEAERVVERERLRNVRRGQGSRGRARRRRLLRGRDAPRDRHEKASEDGEASGSSDAGVGPPWSSHGASPIATYTPVPHINGFRHFRARSSKSWAGCPDGGGRRGTGVPVAHHGFSECVDRLTPSSHKKTRRSGASAESLRGLPKHAAGHPRACSARSRNSVAVDRFRRCRSGTDHVTCWSGERALTSSIAPLRVASSLTSSIAPLRVASSQTSSASADVSRARSMMNRKRACASLPISSFKTRSVSSSLSIDDAQRAAATADRASSP